MKETSKLYVCAHTFSERWKNTTGGVRNSEKKYFWRDEVIPFYESLSEFPFPKQKQARLRGSL